MREHDLAVWTWLEGLLVDYGTIAGTPRNGVPILHIFASPQQAFAETTDLLVSMGWLPGATAAAMRAAGEAAWPQIPLPVITIERDEPVMDTELDSSAPYRRVYLNPQTGQYEAHRWPAHYNCTYRLTVWAKTRATAEFIREWIYPQLGLTGNANTELMLPVVHQPPWGTQIHKFRLDGSNDLSTLEGNTQRYIRYEFMMTLRLLMFYPVDTADSAALVHGVGADFTLLDPTVGTTTQDGATSVAGGVPCTVPLRMTDNLFFFPVGAASIPALWPVTGDGVATAGTWSPSGVSQGVYGYGTLGAAVTAPADTVELLERLTTLDTDGTQVVSISFQYQAGSNPAALTVNSRDVTTNALTPNYLVSLPVTGKWQPVHVFTIVNGGTFQANIAGSGSPSEVTVATVDVRQFLGGTKIPWQSTAVSGSLTRYQWASLTNTPYLAIVVLAPGNTPGPHTVTVEDDLSDPDYTQSRSIDAAVNLGLVFLLQPINGTLGLTIPTALTLAKVYLQAYSGPYNGSVV